MIPISILQSLDDGKIFSVSFIKRGDGNLREMICRRGVLKGVSGAGRWFEDDEHFLLTVWDMEKQDHRCIPVDAILELHHHGKVYHG